MLGEFIPSRDILVFLFILSPLVCHLLQILALPHWLKRPTSTSIVSIQGKGTIPKGESKRILLSSTLGVIVYLTSIGFNANSG